jgi:hypothetical protein
MLPRHDWVEARHVELEVERNVLELRALMPDATETDRLFYEDVWSPRELHHGILLDAVQRGFGMIPAPTNVAGASARIRLVGLLSHLTGMLGVIRLLYYLTGAATGWPAVVAYSRVMNGLRAMGECAVADTRMMSRSRSRRRSAVVRRRPIASSAELMDRS